MNSWAEKKKPRLLDDLYVIARSVLTAGHAPGGGLVPPEGSLEEGFLGDDSVVQHYAPASTILAGAAVLVVEGLTFGRHAVSSLLSRCSRISEFIGWFLELSPYAAT